MRNQRCSGGRTVQATPALRQEVQSFRRDPGLTSARRSIERPAIMHRDTIVFAGLLPHAPILVPSVGHDHLAQVDHTVCAMTDLARRVVAARPQSVLLISPHSPRRRDAFGLWVTPRLRGSLAEFGARDDGVDLPIDQAFVERLEHEAKRRGLRTWRISGEELDHGATVPLSYLSAAGWNGPTVIVSLNGPGEGGLDELGHAIAAAAGSLPRRLAVIASGDMSHRLTASAPGGFHANASRFDETFIARLRDGAANAIQQIDPVLTESAAEDVVDSTHVALAAVGFAREGRAVLSYEGPFGVGYGVAVLFEPHEGERAAGPAVIAHLADLPRVARWAVEAKLTHGPEVPPFQAAGELLAPHGVFVTVRTVDGELRGCRGLPTPTQNDLVWSTAHLARAAAFYDSRFPSVGAEELPRLRFEVSVLSRLEPVASPADLDPARYGVLIAAADGREALLLPGIEGIDSVAEQLHLARRKAGIAPGEPIEIRRFTTRVFEESSPSAKGV